MTVEAFEEDYKTGLVNTPIPNPLYNALREVLLDDSRENVTSYIIEVLWQHVNDVRVRNALLLNATNGDVST